MAKNKSQKAQLIGTNIRLARQHAEMSQLELAHAIGMKGPGAMSYISRIEMGIHEPRISTVLRLAKGLNVSPQVLVSEVFSLKIGSIGFPVKIN